MLPCNDCLLFSMCYTKVKQHSINIHPVIYHCCLIQKYLEITSCNMMEFTYDTCNELSLFKKLNKVAEKFTLQDTFIYNRWLECFKNNPHPRSSVD
ncbi:MAG: hypothetical protein ACFFG0_24470 [Candidatus Thorarchaeota archaeon]